MAISRTKDGRVFVYWREKERDGRSAVKKNISAADRTPKRMPKNTMKAGTFYPFGKYSMAAIIRALHHKPRKAGTRPETAGFFYAVRVGNRVGILV